jgi:hypothetical protein
VKIEYVARVQTHFDTGLSTLIINLKWQILCEEIEIHNLPLNLITDIISSIKTEPSKPVVNWVNIIEEEVNDIFKTNIKCLSKYVN